ncbi:hypothetical protein C8R43DRAFT_907410 [Mycena crocata]|nr:hypothetical protein C8R43DRAFT_907410 [Mycena crocata]
MAALLEQDVVTQPLQLLRNRDVNRPLSAFDGVVAAFAQIGAEHYFVTTNTDYVPAPPSIQIPHALFLRSNMRYGTDDPTLWPQQWTSRYPHLPVIAQKGSRPELDCMWWDPEPSDFIVGTTITRGLGRLRNSCLAPFLAVINELVERCKPLQHSPTYSSPLFAELTQNILMWTEQLQSLPTTYTKMVFGVTSLQRACLELDALYHYMKTYRRLMNEYNSEHGTSVAHCVGAFTTVPSVAQRLWSAGLPFWFLRPTHVFDTENILSVVRLTEPSFNVLDIPGEGTPPVVYSANSTNEKIAAIHGATAHTPWYTDPFENSQLVLARPFKNMDQSPPNAENNPTENKPSLSSPIEADPVAGPSNRCPPSAPIAGSIDQQQQRPQRRSSKQQQHSPKPLPNTVTKSAKTGGRDKFQPLAMQEMPLSIVAWAEALPRVDQSVPPFTLDPQYRRYVLPEPALLVNTSPERRRKFLHHWELLRDGFLYMLAQPGHTQLLSSQEWRDVLEGLLTKRGHPESRTHRRSATIEDRIGPALKASNVSSIDSFPVPLDAVPEFTLAKTREIVWQVAETSFRFEFTSLDKRASKKQRLDEVKACFAGSGLIPPLGMSKCGWASTSIEERHRYVARTATLMLDWTTKSLRPSIILRVSQDVSWSPANMQALETGVCWYYAQAFWEYFGRAAVVPMRLDHDLESEV